MVAKKLFWGMVLILGLLALGGKVSAIAQTDIPTTVLIPGKSLPGSYALPEHLAGEPAQMQQTLPEQMEYIEDWHRLVFQSYRDGNWEIYGADGTGQGQTNFTSSPYSVDAAPRLSPDATRIAFQRSWDGKPGIYVMNWGGGGLRGVTNHAASDYAPAWSPDGQRLAFVSDRDGNTEIYIANLVDSVQTRLTNSLTGDAAPAWSPDGNQIAWVRYQDYYGALWVMNADGSNPQPITGNWPYMGHPIWSPDGSQIALDCDADEDGWNELVLMDSNGINLHIIQDPGSGATDDWMGSWSSNGKAIVYSHVNYVIYNNQLYLESTFVRVLYLDPGNVQNLVTSGYDLLPNWVSLDPWPPVSQVKSLPEYSRASGFWLYWSGVDQGISGLHSSGAYRVEYRIGPSGEWVNIFGLYGEWTNGTDQEFSSEAIYKVYFRSQAKDDAENWESWPTGDGDTWTKLYTRWIKGAIKDVRGNPIPNATMNFSPLPWEQAIKSDLSGQYRIHLIQEGKHTTQVSHDGYGIPDSRTNAAMRDSVQNIFMPPQENLILHGNFEADDALSSWMYDGFMQVELATGYSGKRGADIGEYCINGICLTETEYIGEGNVYSSPTMAVDQLGKVHVIWNRNQYSVRSMDGSWSLPVTLAPNIPDTGQQDDNQSALLVDKQGTLHVVIVGDAGLYYLQKPSLGNWAEPQLFASQSYHPALAVDNDNTLYVSYYSPIINGSGGIFLVKRTPMGEWKQPLQIETVYGGRTLSDVAVGSNHVVSIVYRAWPYETYYTKLLPDGTLTSAEKLMQGDEGDQIVWGAPEIVIDSQGTVHVISEINRMRMYMSRVPGETWSELIPIANDLLSVHMAVDSQEKVYLIGTRQDNVIRYYEKSVSEADFKAYTIPTDEIVSQVAGIDVDRNDLVHLVWVDETRLFHRFTDLAPQPKNGSLSQVVNIPSSNHPTLGFMHMLSHDASSFNISISETPTSTVVITPTTSPSWAHGWVDMTSWAGKTVTVTFALHQAAKEPYAHLYLDDISLGSWLTPIIHEVSPSQVDIGMATTLIITGENFIATPTVRLNDITLANVQFVDSNTLQVPLPGNLPPGIYTLWVINPQGQEDALPGAVQVGWQLYLPMVAK